MCMSNKYDASWHFWKTLHFPVQFWPLQPPSLGSSSINYNLLKVKWATARQKRRDYWDTKKKHKPQSDLKLCAAHHFNVDLLESPKVNVSKNCGRCIELHEQKELWKACHSRDECGMMSLEVFCYGWWLWCNRFCKICRNSKIHALPCRVMMAFLSNKSPATSSDLLKRMTAT